MQYDSAAGIKNTGTGHEALSLPLKLATVIVSPVKTIKSTPSNPGIGLIFPLFIITSVLPYIIRYGFLRNEITLTLTRLSTPTENIGQIVNSTILYNFIALPVVAVFTYAFWSVLIYSASRLMHGEGTLKQYFAIYGYTFPAYFLYACVTIISSYFTGQPTLDLSLCRLLSFFHAGLGGFWAGFLKTVEPFNLWKYFIVFLGLVLIGKLGKYKALAIVGMLVLFSGTTKGIGEVLNLIFSQLK